MARGKGGLGRGLESLFEDASPIFESDAKVETLPLREIEPDPGQPRKTFDQQALGELAASIAEHGLLQPIAVRPQPKGGYSIVAGERRWRACRMAGLNEVPVVVKDVSDEQAMELALVENLQREDLDPVEEATGIRELMTRCSLTQEQAARKLGKSRSALANSLRLLNLPENVLELLKSGFINIGHAKVILGLPTPELQEQAAQIIADNQLNVRQAEALFGIQVLRLHLEHLDHLNGALQIFVLGNGFVRPGPAGEKSLHHQVAHRDARQGRVHFQRYFLLPLVCPC